MYGGGTPSIRPFNIIRQRSINRRKTRTANQRTLRIHLEIVFSWERTRRADELMIQMSRDVYSVQPALCLIIALGKWHGVKGKGDLILQKLYQGVLKCAHHEHLHNTSNRHYSSVAYF